MIIICDMDEVIVDMMNPLLREYNKMYSSDISIEDVTQWELPDDMINKYKEDNFFLTLPPISGAINGLRQLMALGHDVIIATYHGDNPRIAKDKILWMFYNCPVLSANMMIGARKDLLQGDVIIDDNADHLTGSLCKIRIVMDRPWNRHLQERRKIDVTKHGDILPQYCYDMGDIDYRVYNWQQIIDLFAGGACKIW